MSLLNSYTRVSRRHPCPVCAHTDWCLIDSRDPSAPISAICPRVESPRRVGTAGFLHLLKQDGSPVRGCCRTITVCTSRDFSRLATTLHDQAAGVATATLSQMLGVSVASLRRLGVGYVLAKQLDTFHMSCRSGCWTFPMTTADGRIVGIRLRTASGRKFALTGSKNALFVPVGMPATPEYLFITEGESDTAALLDVGVCAVGRPGCQQGAAELRQLVLRLKPVHVVVASDNDEAGHVGAIALARSLRTVTPSVRIIRPPVAFKDMRSWRRSGMVRSDLLAVVKTSVTLRIGMSASEVAR